MLHLADQQKQSLDNLKVLRIQLCPVNSRFHDDEVEEVEEVGGDADAGDEVVGLEDAQVDHVGGAGVRVGVRGGGGGALVGLPDHVLLLLHGHVDLVEDDGEEEDERHHAEGGADPAGRERKEGEKLRLKAK